MDRRAQERCPVCQGPGVKDDSKPDGVRCRKSICAHNHGGVKCPRCGEADLESVDFRAGSYHYVCRECTNRWAVAG